MTKKIFLAFLFLIILAGNSYAASRYRLTLGMISKLNSTEEQFAESWQKNFAPKNANLEVIVKFYETLNAMQLALSKGEINHMVLPDFTASYIMARVPDYEQILVLHSKGTGLAFGFRPDSAALRDEFNKALETLRDDWTLSAIEGMYITPYGADEPEPVKFAHFDGAEKIKVAVTGDLPPIDFIAADGTPAGFNTAVLAEVGAYLKKNIELVNIDAGARTAALMSGRADVVFWYEVDKGAEIQSDVPEGVILSEPYYEWDKFMHLKVSSGKKASDEGWSILNRDFWNLYIKEN